MGGTVKHTRQRNCVNPYPAVAPPASRRGSGDLLGLVAEIGGEPALDFGERHVLAAGVVGDLLAGDAIDGEVAGLWVREVKAADAGGGPHGVAFRELNAGVFFGLK